MINEPAPPLALAQAPFRLDSLHETTAPAGCEGLWYRYVIAQGANTIEGVRAGTLAEVSFIVDAMLARLNMRFAKRTAQPRLRMRKR